MKYIIANWKMNMNLHEIEKWLSQFTSLLEGKSFKNKVVLAASFPHLKYVSDFCSLHNITCSAQDISFYEKGAHTGDVGAFQLREICQFSIVGHSEREESKNMVKEKRGACINHNITPIVCFTKIEEWSQNIVKGALLAWEDPENISKGGVYKEKNPSDIEQSYDYFMQQSPQTPVIYGGSVHRRNAPHLAKIPNVGGVLIGNASLDPQHFMDIISAFE